MMILGINTSGLAGSVALMKEDAIVAQRSLEQAGRRHAQTLTFEVAAMMTALKLEPRDLTAIGVIRGPGSFTGLRVGVVCAKTLSYSLKIPLIVLDTFDVIAAQCPAEFSSVWIVEDAQRQELFIGRYERVADRACRLADQRFIAPAKTWLESLPPEDIVIGPGTLKIPAECRSPQILRDPAISLPRAETVCRLAAHRLAAGDVDDCWTATPFYMRLSGAEEKAAAKGADQSAAAGNRSNLSNPSRQLSQE